MAAINLSDPASQGQTDSFADGLPRDWYTDPAILEQEKRTIFRPAWQFAGSVHEIPDPGDFFTYVHTPAIPTIVVRDDDGSVNAFVNMCRHRGSLVVTEDLGNSPRFTCPYHGWVYGLDGCLRRAPRADRAAERDADLRLFSLRTHIVGPFVFVNADPDAPAFDDVYGAWAKELESEPAVDAGHFWKRHDYEWGCNWKVAVENSTECYHCPRVHSKSLNEAFDLTKLLVYDFKDSYFNEHAIAPADQNGVRPTQPPQTFVWPNVLFNRIANPADVDHRGVFGGNLTGFFINRFDPVAVDRTIQRSHFLFRFDVDEESRQEIFDWLDVVMMEDQVSTEAVQRGLNAGFGARTQLMLPTVDASRQWLGERVERAMGMQA